MFTNCAEPTAHYQQRYEERVQGQADRSDWCGKAFPNPHDKDKEYYLDFFPNGTAATSVDHYHGYKTTIMSNFNGNDLSGVSLDLKRLTNLPFSMDPNYNVPPEFCHNYPSGLDDSNLM